MHHHPTPDHRRPTPGPPAPDARTTGARRPDARTEAPDLSAGSE
jgi:hypothetical protein